VSGVWDKIMARVVAAGEPKLAFACLGVGGRGTIPLDWQGDRGHPGRAAAQDRQPTAALSSFHLPPSQTDQTLLVASERAAGNRDPV
jgi:hypothetical protein